MRLFSIVRHAEAEGNAPGGSGDKGRALTAVGRAAAAALGARLAASRLVPDMVLCSDAVRTMETAACLLEGAGAADALVLPLGEIYSAGSEDMMGLVRAFADPKAPHVMVVGHNPTISAFARLMLARPAPRSAEVAILRPFEPGDCAVFRLPDLEWAHLQRGAAALERFFPAIPTGRD